MGKRANKTTRILLISIDFKPRIMDLVRMIRDRIRGGHGMFVAYVDYNAESNEVDGAQIGYALGPFVGLRPIRVFHPGKMPDEFSVRSLKSGEGVVSQSWEDREPLERETPEEET